METSAKHVTNTVEIVLPGEEAPRLLKVIKTSSGNIIFEGENETGVYDINTHKFYLNTAGNTTKHRRHAPPMDVDRKFIEPFIEAATPSPRALQKMMP